MKCEPREILDNSQAILDAQGAPLTCRECGKVEAMAHEEETYRSFCSDSCNNKYNDKLTVAILNAQPAQLPGFPIIWGENWPDINYASIGEMEYHVVPFTEIAPHDGGGFPTEDVPSSPLHHDMDPNTYCGRWKATVRKMQLDADTELLRASEDKWLTQLAESYTNPYFDISDGTPGEKRRIIEYTGVAPLMTTDESARYKKDDFSDAVEFARFAYAVHFREDDGDTVKK